MIQRFFNSFILGLSHVSIGAFSGFGHFIIFVRSTIHCAFTNRTHSFLIFRHLEFVGNKSFMIILLAALFTGGVFGLQLGVIFEIFSAQGLVGAATGKSLALEMAPVMTGFIVTGRAGAAMAAEIATMRVNEQIDAIEAMGVNPLSYLAVPRILAGVIMMPILSVLFFGIGVLGCYIICIFLYKIDALTFVSELKRIVLMKDIWKGIFKSMVFGGIFSTVACYKGFFAYGGAKGVGEATTKAVVVGLLSILILDFIITFFQT